MGAEGHQLRLGFSYVKCQKYSPNKPTSILYLSTHLQFDPGVPCFINTHPNLSNLPGTFSLHLLNARSPPVVDSCWIQLFTMLQLYSNFFFGSFMEPLLFSLEFLPTSCCTGNVPRELCHTMLERIALGSSWIPTSATGYKTP